MHLLGTIVRNSDDRVLELIPFVSALEKFPQLKHNYNNICHDPVSRDFVSILQ